MVYIVLQITSITVCIFLVYLYICVYFFFKFWTIFRKVNVNLKCLIEFTRERNCFFFFRIIVVQRTKKIIIEETH